MSFGQKTYNYPNAIKESTEDVYFDSSIGDPYQWMENSNSHKLLDWLEIQSKLTKKIKNKHLSTLDLPIFGTFMNGESVYNKPLPEDFVIVMGNEANGVTKGIEELCNHRIAIPQFGSGAPTESLNVATATAITLSEFSRRLIER